MGQGIDLRYKKIRKLGSGGCADAFLARDKKTGRLVTLKCLREGGEKEYKKARESLINEANILRRLRHKGIPALIDSGDEYMAIEFAQGKSLLAVLREQKRLKEKEAVRIAKEILSILGYLHSRKEPIIYRDLKPSNIIISADGEVTLIDYGVSRIYREGERNDSTYLGTCGFAAPEQYGSLGQTNPQTDIYCFGMTLLQMLSGIDTKDDQAVERVKENGVRGVSSELMAVIRKCIKPDRSERFRDVGEIKAALDKCSITKIKRKVFLGIRLSLAAACISMALTAGISHYEIAKEYIQEDTRNRLPAVKERLGRAKVRIEEYMEDLR